MRRSSSGPTLLGVGSLVVALALVLATSPARSPAPGASPSPTPPAAWGGNAVQEGGRLGSNLASGEANEAGGLVVLPSEVPESVPLTHRAGEGEGPKEGASAGKTIVLDPGHGGAEIGAVHYGPGAKADLLEKDVNLKIALKLARLLTADGFRAVLTRDADRGANAPPLDRNGDGLVNLRDDLQARVDIANDAGGNLFLSIHNNGSSSPSEAGTEVWYSPDRPFADRNLALARLLQENLIGHLASVGYQTRDRGIKSDSAFRIWRGRAYNIFVLGPARDDGRHPRATDMPGVLGESLFVSHDKEAQLLQREPVMQGIAMAYREAIRGYYRLYPGE